MNPDRTLLLVGHPTEAVRTAKELGLGVILLQHKSKFEPAQAELADETFLVEYTDWTVSGPLAEFAHRRWGFAAAVSLTDPGLEIAGRVNDRYGLGGTGYDVSHLLLNKAVMREHLRDKGFRATIGFELVRDERSLLAFGADHGYPFIVKPTDTAGGFGVKRVDGPADAAALWQWIAHTREHGMDRGPAALFTITDFIMEEFVDGPEFSVESFSFGGRHIVVAVTEKDIAPGHFAELGHTLPARIKPELESEIVAVTTEFLDTVGLRDGVSHTEIRFGADGPVVIEGHNRGGGDRILDLVRSAYGIDLVGYALGWPFGLVEPLAERPTPNGGAAVRFLHGESGVVGAIAGVDELKERPEVIAAETYVSVGSRVGPLQDDFDRFGLVAVSGADSHAAATQCEKLIAESVRITVEAEVGA
ncbi:ATP-grasp domain-containing protein [Actinokineospora enzanensis]|uniref:ATP-grasp domain-containing protein n=1 Tax=Actinokineospora enzanensis TaxID=155975 RepID=UPI0003603738|nr:ATP-grasp domain-containing protein [Actinokineospora enzanensis]